MASKNPNELRRNGSVGRADNLSFPMTPLPSARTPLEDTMFKLPSNRYYLSRTLYIQAQRIEPAASHPATSRPPAEQLPTESTEVTSTRSSRASPSTTACPPIGDRPPPHPAPTRPAPIPSSLSAAQKTREEWRSWKIGWPWLSFQLFTVVSIVGVVAALDVISRRNSGFARQGKPPAFLAHNPALERAIWSQGILYTAFPAFVMTLYRTMWESTVTAFADRQPYVDLKKRGGRPPQSTIMLDYRTEPFIYGWLVALRNKHFLLAACMFFSVVLALLIVPLTSFLFTTVLLASNTTFPLSFETSFNPDILGEYPSYPDLRLPLDSAAAVRIQDARGPPWTDGEYAFAKFVPLVDVGDGNVALETTAYSAQSGCKYIPESQYQKTVLGPGDTGIPALSIEIAADDRGCQISNSINLRLTPEHPDATLKIWTTTSCASDAGWSRFSILTAMHTNASTSVTNFSLISCAPSYWITSGRLSTITGAISATFLRTFAPHPLNASQFRPEGLWRFFEMGIQVPGCFNPMTNVDSNNEFGRYVYKIANKNNPTSPLLPEVILDAAQTLFATTFAIFASMTLFKPTSTPLNGTGVHTVEEMRLIVLSPVAYIVLGVLVTVAILNISLFFHARQESMLYEEPVGLLSMSGILHNSDVNIMIEGFAKEPDFNGKTTEAATKEAKLDQRRYHFNERDKRIVRLPTPLPP